MLEVLQCVCFCLYHSIKVNIKRGVRDAEAWLLAIPHRQQRAHPPSRSPIFFVLCC
jgi:hypothetical protein